MYIRCKSRLLGPNNTLEWEFKRIEALTMKTTVERVTLQFISHQESLTLQKGHYKPVVFQKAVIEYFKKRGIGATIKVISEDLNVDPSRLQTCIHKMVAGGKLAKKGKWNQVLGRETIFRGYLHGYVYGLTPEQCERFVKSGEVLTPIANAILKEVIKNSNEKRLTPLNTFVNPPYNYDSASVTYESEVLTNAFKNITKTSCPTGQRFLYDKEKLTEEDVRRGIEDSIQKFSKKKSLTYVIGEMHEKIVQMGLDEMSKGPKFDVRFLSVVRGKKISFQIRLSTGRELDRTLLVSMDPLGTKHYYPIEAKYQRSEVTTTDVLRFYDTLRNSYEYGCSIEHNGQQVRVLKAGVTPILVAPKVNDEARKWALQHGIMIVPTWRITRYYRKKYNLKSIKIEELAKEFVNRTNKKQTLDEFLESRLKVKRSKPKVNG